LLFIASCSPQQVSSDTVKEFINSYQADFEGLWEDWTHTEWDAAISGKKEDFEAHAKADAAINHLHSDKERYRRIKDLLMDTNALSPIDARALQIASLAFGEHQIPKDMIEDMSQRLAQIGQVFNTFRGDFQGNKYSDNELLSLLGKEKSNDKRKELWQALKQVGAGVAPKLINLAKIRNNGAKKQGFKNFWEMKIVLQEHDPDYLMNTFSDLEKMTDEPFRKMKNELDKELAEKFNVSADSIMPWHYDNPFFQAAPPAKSIDLDDFYKSLTKEQIVEKAVLFFNDIGLPIEDIVARSDLYEREGKDQGAFCEDMDRKGDVRTLCNIRPTAEWMDTLLHENGHAVYDKYLDMDLPFNLRQSSHIFSTEGVAMLFGALAKNPSWIAEYTESDKDAVMKLSKEILEQRRREQLIFCRWTLVMLHFEKALYENPDQDLNTLWWDYVEKYQFVNRPKNRNAPDWAAKSHFSSAPVYYHNYMLGELFAAQLRASLAKIAGHKGSTSSISFNNRKDFGIFLREKIFKPGKTKPWPKFVKEATGEELTAKYFAAEL